MQILTLLGIGKTLTKIVAALYRSIAAIYTDMLNLVDTFTKGPLADTLNSIVGNVYVLVGVFMLFRIGVSLLNYLVDPSKLDDKKVGGGQLVMHILISIVLLLSLNFVFKWTNDLQTVLLEKDGILYKIISTGNSEMSKLNDLQLFNTQEVSVVSKKYLASENKTVDCYYTYRSYIYEDAIRSGKNNVTANNWGKIKFTFTIDNNVNPGGENKNILVTGKAFSIGNGKPLENKIGDGNTYYFHWKSENISGGVLYAKDEMKSVLMNGNCPASIPNIECSDSPSPVCKFTTVNNGNVSTTLSNTTLGNKQNGLTNPGHSVSEAQDAASSACSDIFINCSTDSDELRNSIKEKRGAYDNSKIGDDGFEFSTITLSAFVTPSAEFDSTFLKSYSGDYSSDWWANQIEDENTSDSGITYSMDWLLAIICGIAIIVILVAIMIEVVVRNLKLVILQAIAPIPVVSYMNPNDKMLGTWAKQYVGVYFSLFLQLLVILLIPNLMMSLLRTITGGFIIKIIIIAGCLLFMKQAPKFIGKLLGLDNMEGSFGDALKMAKTGLGFAARTAGATLGGAIIGGATAAYAGGGWAGFGAGFAGGALRGGWAGARKKSFGQAVNSQIQANKRGKEGRAYGATLLGTTKSKINQKLGKTDEYEGFQAQKEAYTSFDSAFGKLKGKAKEEVAKDWHTQTNLEHNGVMLNDNVNLVQRRIEQAQSTGGMVQVRTSNGTYQNYSAEEASSFVGLMEKQAINDAIDTGKTDNKPNEDIMALKTALINMVDADQTGALTSLGVGTTTSAKDLGDRAKYARNTAEEMENRSDVRKARAEHEMANGSTPSKK